MAASVEAIEKDYPLPTYRFRVSIGDEIMAFSSVSGLKMTRQKIVYRDGMGGLFQMLGFEPEFDITLSRGIVRAQDELWSWLNSASGRRIEKRDILISLTNEAGTELLVTWSVLNAFPISLSAPNFNATSNEVALEELQLAADSLRVEFH